ncbi:MAG: cbb3-type cytochrome oxidase assembly protein CcoS [Magnetococcales bacterium]|nr:cbb3-type cytochrome oxidase assembly protein CcoS [Magnetococcales bacterium]
MDILYLLLPLALILGVIGLGMMIWALKNNQFEDMEGAAQRILYDDDQGMIPTAPPAPTPAPNHASEPASEPECSPPRG